MPVTTRATPLAGVTHERLWAWHLAPGAFERLVPPWHRVTLDSFPTPFAPGASATLTQALGPLPLRWRSRLVEVTPPHGFVDVAEGGPFASWRHAHRFDTRPDGVTLIDEIAWEPPLGALGRAVAGRWITRELHAFLAHRHRRTAEDLARHAALGAARPLRVGITGVTGLVGADLATFLTSGGHEVVPLVRSGGRHGLRGVSRTIPWDPARGPDPADLVGLDAVVHLAGEPISGGRWTAERKRRIVDSRVVATRSLAEAIARCPSPPPVLVSASAVGWWGDRDVPVDEDDAPGTGFLADTAVAWEAAADPARAAGVRVVHPRVGIVQSGRGGQLATTLPLFRLGLGGPIGHGRQALPWVALDDLVAMISQAIVDPRFEGPFAAVAPEPVSQAGWAAALGRALGRPACLPAPAAALRLALGREMADALALGGAPVRPSRLRAWGFRWSRGELDDALVFEVGGLRGT